MDVDVNTECAVLAGGCFWGMQDLIRRRDGVISTRVGYTGGDVPHATYRNHRGHAEAIEVIFDPSSVTYRDLLEFFFQIHDPTTLNPQGNDIGTSYRSAIFYTSEEQKRVAEDTIADVDASGPCQERSSQRSCPPASSGKLSLNTKTTLNGFQTGIPVISYARAGHFPTEAVQTSRLNNNGFN